VTGSLEQGDVPSGDDDYADTLHHGVYVKLNLAELFLFNEQVVNDLELKVYSDGTLTATHGDDALIGPFQASGAGCIGCSSGPELYGSLTVQDPSGDETYVYLYGTLDFDGDNGTLTSALEATLSDFTLGKIGSLSFDWGQDDYVVLSALSEAKLFDFLLVDVLDISVRTDDTFRVYHTNGGEIPGFNAYGSGCIDCDDGQAATGLVTMTSYVDDDSAEADQYVYLYGTFNLNGSLATSLEVTFDGFTLGKIGSLEVEAFEDDVLSSTFSEGVLFDSKLVDVLDISVPTDGTFHVSHSDGGEIPGFQMIGSGETGDNSTSGTFTMTSYDQENEYVLLSSRLAFPDDAVKFDINARFDGFTLAKVETLELSQPDDMLINVDVSSLTLFDDPLVYTLSVQVYNDSFTATHVGGDDATFAPFNWYGVWPTPEGADYPEISVTTQSGQNVFSFHAAGLGDDLAEIDFKLGKTGDYLLCDVIVDGDKMEVEVQDMKVNDREMMKGDTVTNVWDVLLGLNDYINKYYGKTPFLTPTSAPTPKPTPTPIPMPTVQPGNPTNPPTRIPTPAPSRTPMVVTSVSLSGITCDEFEADVYITALDKTIGEGDADFSDPVCTDASSTRASGVSISTDLTVSRSVAAANNADSAFEHVLSVLDGSEETLEANIIDGVRRRLGMADISVESISANTFAPSAAPTPTPKPTSAALTAAPTAAPIAATTTTTTTTTKGSADLTVIIIICCVVGALLLVVVGVVVVKSQNTEGAQKPAWPAAPEEQKTLAPEEISLEEAKPNAHFSL